ncbi:MAG: hypothetical protein V4497_04145 [Bacteroidota bacterium]
MKKKYFILAITFLCLLVSGNSFGQNVNSDYGDDDNDEVCSDVNTELIQSFDCVDIYLTVESTYYCDSGVQINLQSFEDHMYKECGTGDSGDCHDPSSSAYPCDDEYIDIGDCTDYRSSAYPCYVDTGDCRDPRSSAYPCYFDSGDCTDPRSYSYPCNDSSCPVGFTKENVMQNDLSSCKEDFVITGIKVSDSKNRTANTNETLFMLDDDKKITITSILDRNVWTAYHHIITQFAVNNITDTHLTAVSGTKTATGGWPNSSTHNVEVSILPKISYVPVSSLSFPGVTSNLDAIARNANVIGSKTSFNLNISRSIGENEVDPSSRFIRTFTKYSGSFGFSTSSGDVAVPGWSFQTPPGVPTVEAGLYLSISGGASCTVNLKKYQLNNNLAQDVYLNDSSVTVTGSATVKATAKALAEAQVLLYGSCTFETGCSVSVGAELTATANDGTVKASLNVGQLKGNLYYKVKSGDIYYSNTVSVVLSDGFKLINNQEIFTY